MAERKYVTESATTGAFLAKIRKFREEYPQESEKLCLSLMQWAACVGSRGESAGDVVTTKIKNNLAEIRRLGLNISIEKYLDKLFCPNKAGQISADIILGRLQSGSKLMRAKL